MRSLLALGLLVCCGVVHATIPTYTYKVVKRFPHSTSAYTEGLFYKDGYLYEATGEKGESTVRKVDLDTGRAVQQISVPPSYFGEGIVAWKHHLIQLTWQSHKGFVYDLDSLKKLHDFSYPGEGWALTRNSKHIYMSDGTTTLRILDPDTLKQTGTIEVTAGGEKVGQLNELEWVDGEIYANIWLTNRIARIDPKTGHVVGWIDLTGLFDNSKLPIDDVLNGIAWDARHKRLFVTGKRWPTLFQITLVKKKAS